MPFDMEDVAIIPIEALDHHIVIILNVYTRRYVADPNYEVVCASTGTGSG